MATMGMPMMAREAPWESKHSTGTTTIACEFDGGIIVGADSRTSTGSYVANRFADKLTPLSKYIYCCRSGSAADTQAISDIVRYHLSFHKMELGEEPTVEIAANLLKELCYNYRDSLTAGMIVAGWDAQKGSQVYSIPIGGMCVRQKIVTGGSGSTFVYGYIDKYYKPTMTREECIEFVKNAVSLAMLRDGHSGGVVRYGVITSKGIERGSVLPPEQPKFIDA